MQSLPYPLLSSPGLNRATQYAVKAVLKMDGSGILDHPLSRMMTAECGIAAASR
jgi:hypothetical protein